MELTEWVWLFDVKKPNRTQKWAGSLTDNDVAELFEQMKDAESNGKN
jgi:hypothetical protein